MEVVDVVATCNMQKDVGHRNARAGLFKVLDAGPVKVGAIALQEWGRGRGLILWRLGRRLGYRWKRPLTGGGPIGLDRDRYRPRRCRRVTLAKAGKVDKSPGRRRKLGPSKATLVIADDLLTGEVAAFIDFHLTAEVQDRHGHYRKDRPLRVARHRDEEVPALERLIGHQRRMGRVVHAAGDSNFDGLQLAGLTSAWVGHGRMHGTLGNRKPDDVHGPGPADDVDQVVTASDHRSVVATRRRTV